MNSDPDAFHYAIFTPEEVESGYAFLRGWDKGGGSVNCYPAHVGVAAVKDAYHGLPDPGEYWVTAVRLRDHAGVLVKVVVEATTVTRTARDLAAANGESRTLEGGVAA